MARATTSAAPSIVQVCTGGVRNQVTTRADTTAVPTPTPNPPSRADNQHHEEEEQQVGGQLRLGVELVEDRGEHQHRSGGHEGGQRSAPAAEEGPAAGSAGSERSAGAVAASVRSSGSSPMTCTSRSPA